MYTPMRPARERATLSSSQRFGKTERGIIARPRWTRFYYRLFNNQLFIPNSIRQLNEGKGRNERGTFKQAHLVHSTYAGMHVCNQCTYSINGGRDKTRARQRATTVYLLCTVTYRQFYLTDLAPHLSFKKNKEKPHQRQGGRLDLWGLYVHGAV